MLIFDIGANNGNFTQSCLSIYPNATIVTIEPNDSLIPTLKKRFVDHNNVIILNTILSNRANETIDFYIGNYSTISTASKDWMTQSRFAKDHLWNKAIKKISTTLDVLILEFPNPDLIKIDVEGYELQVIQGLSIKQKHICFEWTEECFEKTNMCCEHLSSLGYENFGYLKEDPALQQPQTYSEWRSCAIHNEIIPDRKKLWGMIWVKE